MLGDDRTLWHDGMGEFTLEAVLPNDAGMAALTDPREYDALKRDLVQAGYKGGEGGAARADRLPKPSSAG